MVTEQRMSFFIYSKTSRVLVHAALQNLCGKPHFGGAR